MKWQPTIVFLPEKSHGQRSLVGCSLWGRKESDMTEHTYFNIFSWMSARLLKARIPIFHTRTCSSWGLSQGRREYPSSNNLGQKSWYQPWIISFFLNPAFSPSSNPVSYICKIYSESNHFSAEITTTTRESSAIIFYLHSWRGSWLFPPCLPLTPTISLWHSCHNCPFIFFNLLKHSWFIMLISVAQQSDSVTHTRTHTHTHTHTNAWLEIAPYL